MQFNLGPDLFQIKDQICNNCEEALQRNNKICNILN